eukprot:TRINITY_DN6321_c0_g1_i1.p1 TRINITY_DN6321_c0_g1~~TRINITY_DN6321_c0_g1_i1.p1  ORF type:complete len:692 (+),score=122.84 TRINITY_DN6321_c0_g1_i1:403-2478(+)
MAAVEGEERVIATAQQIVRSLATTDTMTKDMLSILSSFDHRFSTMTERLKLEQGLEDRLASAEETVLRWDNSADSSLMIWEGPPDEAASYLQAVDEIQYLAETLEGISISDQKEACNNPNPNPNVDSENEADEGVETNSRLLDRAHNVLQIAMARLEDEFRNILVQQSEVFEPERLYQQLHGPISRVSFRSSVQEDLQDPSSPYSDNNGGFGEDQGHDQGFGGECKEELLIDLIRPEAIPDLKDIAKRMIAANYATECCQVFSSVRREVLEEGLHRLGFEKLSIEDVQKMDWDVLEGKIKRRIQAMKIAVRVLFASERRLCDEIFGEFGEFKDICFTESVRGSVMQLLNFSEAIAISRRSSERLFRILDMYECLAELIPDINSIFSAEACASIRAETAEILVRLGEAAKGTFVEFENNIKKETSKTPIPGGAVHPLTRYVMNYVKFLFVYTDTLKQLFHEKVVDPERQLSNDLSGFNAQTNEEDVNLSQTPLAQRFLNITSLLEANIEAKAKFYKDPSLSYLFLMNNIHYIVKRVKGSELSGFLGENWIRKRSSQVRQYATSYQRAAWNKVLQCLRDEGISGGGAFSSKISKETLKERFRSFNATFEDVYRNQIDWVVQDTQLREELRISIAEKLLPAYRSFLGRFKSHLEGGRHADRYIKYSPEDLENYLLDIFKDAPGSTHHLRRKSSS